MNAKPAAEPWRTDEPPKDGSTFLALWTYSYLGFKADDIVPLQWSKSRKCWVILVNLIYRELHWRDPDYWAEINPPEMEVK